MSLVNRAAVVIKPKQPFLDWLRHLPQPVPDQELASASQDLAVYLVPESEHPAAIERGIYGEFDFFFEDMLESWWSEEKDFPKDRTLAMFQAWFTVEVHSVVEDLVDGPLGVEDESE